MKIDLSARRAVVTGGSRGIGRAIALGLAEAGASVSVCARGADGLAPVRDAIAAHGVAAHAQACDIADPEALSAYIDAAAAGARRHRHPGVQRLGVRHDRRRGRLEAQHRCRSARYGARDPGGRAAYRKGQRRRHRQHFVDLGDRRLGPHASLRRGESGDHVVHTERSGRAGDKGHPGQLRRAGVDRVSRRHAGSGRRRTIPGFTARSCAASRSAGSAIRRRSPTSSSSSPRRSPTG